MSASLYVAVAYSGKAVYDTPLVRGLAAGNKHFLFILIDCSSRASYSFGVIAVTSYILQGLLISKNVFNVSQIC